MSTAKKVRILLLVSNLWLLKVMPRSTSVTAPVVRTTSLKNLEEIIGLYIHFDFQVSRNDILMKYTGALDII